MHWEGGNLRWIAQVGSGRGKRRIRAYLTLRSQRPRNSKAAEGFEAASYRSLQMRRTDAKNQSWRRTLEKYLFAEGGVTDIPERVCAVELAFGVCRAPKSLVLGPIEHSGIAIHLPGKAGPQYVLDTNAGDAGYITVGYVNWGVENLPLAM
jgi:hypothetical protein